MLHTKKTEETHTAYTVWTQYLSVLVIPSSFLTHTLTQIHTQPLQLSALSLWRLMAVAVATVEVKHLCCVTSLFSCPHLISCLTLLIVYCVKSDINWAIQCCLLYVHLQKVQAAASAVVLVQQMCKGIWIFFQIRWFNDD